MIVPRKVEKICLTGGPCGGKSSSLSYLKRELEERGYNVIIIPETATYLINDGFIPGITMTPYDFQRMVFKKQIADEDLVSENVSKLNNNKKTVILCDRGIGDQYAFLPSRKMDDIIHEHNLTRQEVLCRYDCVIHLKTAADGCPENYQWNDPESDSVGNNEARLTPPDEALRQDKATIDSWLGHPHFRVIDNSTDFKGKVDRVLEEVLTALGEPVPKETERKFLIEMPSESDIKKLGNVFVSHITQTYLVSNDPDVERRVRKRGTDINGYAYFYTEKSTDNSGVRTETERMISDKEYATYIKYDADPKLNVIEKDRCCFLYNDQYFEMDTYPFDQERAILEIELNDLNDKVEIPENLTVIKEVTKDRSYYNSSIAKNLSFEPFELEKD